MSDPKRQCVTCPWREGATTDAIPGYSRAQHEALRATIAKPGALPQLGPVRVMACHYSREGDDRICVGWAANQLHEGNNLALRLLARKDTRFHGLETVGPQRAHFEDTFE